MGTYSIKLQVADSDMLDIFDRSQRTLAATLAKVGDYDYYTPFQRIGSFIDFSQTLRWEDLKNIEKHVFYLKNQVGFLRSEHNTQPKSQLKKKELMKKERGKENNFKDPNSLFHGFMKDEYFSEEMLEKIGTNQKTYDPTDYLPKCQSEKLHDPAFWTEEFSKKINIAINNYNKYMNSNKILLSDLNKFNKKVFKKFLTNVDINLLNNPNHKKLVDNLFKEIEERYYITLKNIIMEYILRSPFERKRLNIQYLPRKVLPSSYIIAHHGSFNRTIYSNWVENYSNSFNLMSKNLTICNIINSSLCDWTHNFKHVDLLYISRIYNLINNLNPNKKFNTMHLDEFYQMQYAYLQKTFNFIKHIYFRGVLLITRKSKCLKRKLIREGKWTFKGYVSELNTYDYVGNAGNDNSSYIANNTVHSDSSSKRDLNYYNDAYGMEYTDHLDDFWTSVNYDDLIDIRINPSYFAYATLLNKTQVDLSVNEYDEMNVDSKIRINNCVTTYCTIFLRRLVEKSIEDLSNFILSFGLPSESEKIEYLSTIFQKSNSRTFNVVSLINYNEKELKLPNLKAFISNENTLIRPLINIKTKFDSNFNVVKLEYTYDQVIDFFVKLFDSTITLFNGLLTTHFLEFQEIPPTEIERIQKEHINHLNEIFTESKQISFNNEYFANLCPNIIVEESKLQSHMKNYLRVAYPNEEIFMTTKNKIIRHLKYHYNEMEECLNVFEPIKELINNTFHENIYNFLDIISTSPDYKKYSYFLDKIRTYQKYVNTIPKLIYYPMFAIDLTETKNELIKKLNDMQINLFKKLEDIIIVLFNGTVDKYQKMHKMLDKRLHSPDDSVEMEKIKNNMSADFNSIQNDFNDAMKIFYYLISVDNIFSDILLAKIEEAARRHQKFKKDYDEYKYIFNFF